MNLSPRERQITDLLSDGRTNKEIASSLKLSVSTVMSYLRNIFKKLRARNRAHAAIIAKRVK